MTQFYCLYLPQIDLKKLYQFFFKIYDFDSKKLPIFNGVPGGVVVFTILLFEDSKTAESFSPINNAPVFIISKMFKKFKHSHY